MSNKNYSNFFDKKNNIREEVSNLEINEVVEENNNEIMNEEIINEEVIENIQEKTIGTVINCEKLNVRKEANVDSEVLAIVSIDEQLSIDINNSTEHFYKVMTSEGVEGYCMKQYIAVV